MYVDAIRDESELRADFSEYLKSRYAGSTAGIYVSAINGILKKEQATWTELAGDIDYYVTEYGPNGAKSTDGMKNNALAYNALRRFKLFIAERREAYDDAEIDIAPEDCLVDDFGSNDRAANNRSAGGNEKKLLTVEVNAAVLDRAEEVLENVGLSVEAGIGMFLKRVEREGGIGFMTNSVTANSCAVGRYAQHTIAPRTIVPTYGYREPSFAARREASGITKNQAVYLFRRRGNAIGKEVTFASKNSGARIYWANPSFEVLNNDWSLILNDKNENKLYLFTIRARDISPSELRGRADVPERIDLQILYGDPSFTDTRSGVSFARFKVDEVEY